MGSALRLVAGAYLLLAGIVTVAAVYLRILGVFSIADIVYYYHPELDWQYLLSIILTGPTLAVAIALQYLRIVSFYITWSWFTALSIVGGSFLIFRNIRRRERTSPSPISSIRLIVGMYLLLAGWAAIDTMTVGMMIHGRLLDWLYIFLSAPVFGVAYALMYIGVDLSIYIAVMCILSVLAIIGSSFLLFWNVTLPNPIKKMIASAAIYAVLSFVPIFRIDFGVISALKLASPVMGIILGPIVGAASVAIGGIIGVMLNPASATLGYGTEYIFLSTIPGTVCAFTSGMIRMGRLRKVASILSALVVAFLVYPPNHVQPIFPYYVWIHLVAIFILISPMGKRATKLARRPKVNEAFMGMALIVFPSTMAEQLTWSIIFAFLMGPSISWFWREYGMAVMLALPIERALIIVGSSIIGVSVLRFLRATTIDDDHLRSFHKEGTIRAFRSLIKRILEYHDDNIYLTTFHTSYVYNRLIQRKLGKYEQRFIVKVHENKIFSMPPLYNDISNN